jgi:metal-responsive CopG/Arc/MetJ family transcriptional regulator
MAKKKSAPDTAKWTKPSQFRLSADTLEELDWLISELGLKTRADVIRFAVRSLAKEKGHRREK